MSFTNMLTWWQWVIMGLIPPAIIVLYFLKLRRRPVEVPSTYLWSRTIEDLHVNSLWQRLRKSLLLFLQLAVIGLLIIACFHPGWRGAELTGDRFVFVLDNSASMSAKDVSPSRLEQAKKQVEEMIENMQSGDVAMLISFADGARVEQPFTDSRRALRRSLAAIRPTSRTTDLKEALQAAAGLANPGRSSDEENPVDVPTADPLKATLYIFSDGGFPPVQEFSPGHLTPVYVPIGLPEARNIGVVAFSTERNPEKPGVTQAFARLENYQATEQTVQASLYVNGEFRDSAEAAVPAEGFAGVEFTLTDAGGETLNAASLRLVIEQPDDLAVDNEAFATINPPRRANVLFVTPGNERLRLAMSTEVSQKLAQVQIAKPEILKTKEHQENADAAVYDLIIYDRCAPEKMPQASTLFIGRIPPGKEWKKSEPQGPVIIVDADKAHPLMQSIELRDVRIVEAFSLTPPKGSTKLIDADIETIFAVAPRDSFEDAVLGFEIFSTNEAGELTVNTDWPNRVSFPVFVQNALQYLGGSRQGSGNLSVEPGQPITLRTDLPVKTIRVKNPAGESMELARKGQSTFVYQNTQQPGIYEVYEGSADSVGQRFAVNLFSSTESNLKPRVAIGIGAGEPVTGQSGYEPARKEAWKWILIAALLLLVFEWYVFNRRVYF